MIAKDERGHGFHYRHCSRKDARIVASTGGKLRFLLGTGNGFLLERDGGGRLKRHAKVNIFPIADPALHASGVIRRCPNFSAAHFERIIVLRATHPRRCEPGANLESFGGGYAQHRFRQVCFEFVENRLAQSRGDAARNALNHAADGVAFIANLFDQRDHFLRCRSIWAANDIFFHVFHLHRGTVDFCRDLMNLRHVSDDLEIRV